MHTETFKRVPEVVEARVGDKAFLLHVNHWIYLELNESAGRIWNLLDEGRTLDELTSELGREFAVDPDVCGAETAEFLAMLESREFVVRS